MTLPSDLIKIGMVAAIEFELNYSTEIQFVTQPGVNKIIGSTPGKLGSTSISTPDYFYDTVELAEYLHSTDSDFVVWMLGNLECWTNTKRQFEIFSNR